MALSADLQITKSASVSAGSTVSAGQTFSYTLLVRPRGRPLVAVHTDDLECASAVLEGRGFRVLRQSDLSR